ncbi:MAG: helix-turn-helix transcriptional regulator [Bacilli bacterium]|nr:helix-turn-helix transcriptional regulator [Bacilli bacterium]
MSIYVNLDEIIKKNNLTSKELADIIGITEANLSILRSNKARAIRFSTLNKLCKVLKCEPGDIIKFIDDDNDGEDNDD